MKKTKEMKRREAAERQAHYNTLSRDEKLLLIASRRGQSKAEKARLLKQA